MKANTEVRKIIRESGLFNYEVADALGVQESYFSKLLRKELSPERKVEILTAIDNLRGERVNAVR